MKLMELKSAGPVLCFVPGFPNNHRVWSYQQAAFADRAYVILCDLGNLHFSDIVNKIAIKLRQVSTQHPDRNIYLIGHDLGCFIVNEVCQTNPGLIQGQILLNGVSIEQYAKRIFRFEQWLKSSYVWFLLTPLVKLIKLSVVQTWLIKRVYDSAGLTSNSSLRRGIMNSWDHVGLYRAMTQRVWGYIFGRTKREPHTTPTLMIHGSRDPFLVAPGSKELQASYRSVDLRVLGLGHWSPYTDFQTVNEYIETFCFTSGELA